MSAQSTTDLLGAVPLFESFSKRQLAKLASLLREEAFNPGEDVVLAGGTGGRFYVITKGRASVFSGSKKVASLGPGGYFGEMSLLDGAPRSATVRAETSLTTLSLSRLSFLSILEDNWALTKRVLADLCERIRAVEHSV